MRKLIVLTIAIAIVGMAASITPMKTAALSDCEPGAHVQQGQTTSGGVVVFRWQICPTLGTLVLTYSEWIGSDPPISRNATQAESDSYADGTTFAAVKSAETRLSAEVELGKKWVEALRDWEAEELGFYANWDSLSPAVKDAIAKESLLRDARVHGGLADLLIVLGKGY